VVPHLLATFYPRILPPSTLFCEPLLVSSLCLPFRPFEPLFLTSVCDGISRKRVHMTSCGMREVSVCFYVMIRSHFLVSSPSPTTQALVLCSNVPPWGAFFYGTRMKGFLKPTTRLCRDFLFPVRCPAEISWNCRWFFLDLLPSIKGLDFLIFVDCLSSLFSCTARFLFF